MNVAIEAVAVGPKTKRTMLPLLFVLFLVSYGLMAMLVVEQGKTIDSQRILIRQLFTDSAELSHMKGQAFQKQRDEAQAKSHAQVQAPSSQDKHEDVKKEEAGKVRKPGPRQRSHEASEVVDERRSLVSI